MAVFNQSAYDELIAQGWAWSDFSKLVYGFAVVLRAADLIPDDEDEYWEKPYRFDRVRELWMQAGEPVVPQSGAVVSLAWERFVRSATEAEDGQW